MHPAWFLVLALACAAACRGRLVVDAPLPPQVEPLPSAEPTPEERERCRLAAEYSESHGGLSLLVVRGDHVICEVQHGENRPETPHHLFSGTKTFACALSAVLRAEHGLALDAPASVVLPEWRADVRKAKITPRQLLQFTSGLEPAQWKLTLDGLRAEQRVADKYGLAVSLAADYEPGTHYQYGSSHLVAFGALTKRLTGRDPVDLLEEKVFAPIGFRHAGWIRDPSGNSMLPYGAWTTAREWARFGMLLRDGGSWRGKRILDPELVADCFRGSEVMPAYGLGVWLNRPVSSEQLEDAEAPLKLSRRAGRLLYPEGPEDLVAAAGHKDQRLYIVPSRGLVSVRLGDGDRGFRDAELLARVLDGREQ